MAIPATQIRRGMVIVFEGEPCRVIEFRHCHNVQLEMDDEMLGDNAQWMQPGMKIQAEYYDGRPVGIKLPNSLVLEVVDTAPVMKTATKTASSKPAKLENGVTINVPEFVGTGDKVKVNPSTGEYQERAK